jgi:diaminopimelate epimerase
MIAAARQDGVTGGSTYVVDVPGGRLVVTERADGQVELTGPAVLVARGVTELV